MKNTVDHFMKVIPIFAEAGIGQANGESMQGVGIFNGDLLIVDRSLTAKNGDFIVANYNGCFVCKLIVKK